MSVVNAFDVPGITVVAVQSSNNSMTPETGGGVTPAVPGVDYSVAAGVVTVLTSLTSIAFYFHDSGGTLAAAVEFPAIVMLGTYVNNAGVVIDSGIKGATTVQGFITTGSHTRGNTYVGSDLAMGLNVDGAFPAADLTGSTMKLEVTYTAGISSFWTDFVGCIES